MVQLDLEDLALYLRHPVVLVVLEVLVIPVALVVQAHYLMNPLVPVVQWGLVGLELHDHPAVLVHHVDLEDLVYLNYQLVLVGLVVLVNQHLPQYHLVPVVPVVLERHLLLSDQMDLVLYLLLLVDLVVPVAQLGQELYLLDLSRQ